MKLRAVAVVAGFALAICFGPALRAEAADPAGQSYSMVNAARSAHGKATLSRNGGLDSVARNWANRMASEDRISHNPNVKAEADAAGVHWTLIGENVGVGASVEKVHEAFMASSGHKLNVLHGDYNLIGVGVAPASDGGVFVAHVFARVQSSAPAPAPAVVAPAPAQTQPAAPATQAPASQVAGTSQTPAPQPQAQPIESPSADPNALVGGIVNE
jgi:hypothetical protein